MRRIAQARDRWSLRRSSPTIPTKDDNICQRCRYLQLERYVEQDSASKNGVIAKIQMKDLLDACNLCQQFLAIFNALTGVDADAIADADADAIKLSEFVLSCSPLYIPDERGSCKDINFNLYYGTPTRVIRLFPTEAHLESLVIQDRQPLCAVGKTIVPDSPDLESVRTLIDVCRRSHGLTCASSLPRTHTIRIIDCKTRQLTTVGQGHPYVCLSYVWGAGTLGDEGFYGATMPQDVPKTVEDAMFVAINVGIPFLWVDRYCIDQDNPDEKHNVIRNMDRIYQGAELTIIAAIGDDPNHGLPGVRGTPRRTQCRLNVGSRAFVGAEEVAEDINMSRWNSRAWTLQESLLSRRRLVFTKSQLYFQCKQSYNIESLSPGISALSGPLENIYQVFPHRGIGQTVRELEHHLSEYYERQLSFKADIVDAIAGIINAFSVHSSFLRSAKNFYGLPIFYHEDQPDRARISLLNSLRWTVTMSQESTLIFTGTFPSWSWASVKADLPVDAPGKLHNQFGLDTLRESWLHKDVNIQICHQSQGAMDISAFTSHADDYKQFSPWLDITTWTRELFINTETRYVQICNKLFPIEDDRAVQKQQVMAICLKLSAPYDMDKIRVSGLIVVEAEPGTYRRVRTFAADIDIAHFEPTAREKEIWAHSVQVMNSEVPDNEEIRIALAQGRIGPPLLSRPLRNAWTRQTLRLI